MKRPVARALARARGLRPRAADRWLPGAVRMIEAGPYRRDLRAALVGFATELAGRSRGWELAVLLRADVTASALGRSVRSVTTYRQILTGLGLLATVEEGSTAALRASYRGLGRSGVDGNLAAVLLFTAPVTSEVAPRPSSVEEGSRRGVPTREGSTERPPAAQPRPNPRDRRGRSRRLAAEVRAAVEELAEVSVAAVATVLRQHGADHWSAEDVRTGLRFSPGWQPWQRDGQPVRRPLGWFAYRLRAWAGGFPPASLRRELEAQRNPAGVARRVEDDLAAEAAVPMPADVAAERLRLRAVREELHARQRAREAAERDRVRAWALAQIDLENPWPATR